jgi:hypothetical protein
MWDDVLVVWRRSSDEEPLVADLVGRLQPYRREGVAVCRDCRRWGGADTSDWVEHNRTLYCRDCATRLQLQPDRTVEDRVRPQV